MKTFSPLECETGFEEYKLSILVVLGSWLAFITFTKISWTEFLLLDVLLDIKFCFKCWKVTLWFHLEHQQYEQFLLLIFLFQILLQILGGWNLEYIL